MGLLVDNRPFPQANSLDVIVTVADALADGPMTSDEIAQAIGKVARQGNYYPHAAASLGFVIDTATRPVEWVLTDLGEDLVAANADDRVAIVNAAVLGYEHVHDWFEDAAELMRTMTNGGLNEETVARRMATIASWAQFVTQSASEQAAKIASAQKMTTAGAARVRAARPVIVPPRPCTSCFLIIPQSCTECPDCT
jgi:hypothetical protein